MRTSPAGTGAGRAYRLTVISPLSATSVWPGGSLRASLKIVSGEGIELKARNDSSASGSISRENPGWRSRALSSEANESWPAAAR